MLCVAEVFQNQMVLQRGKPIKIWGASAPLVSVKVIMGSVEQDAISDADGHWEISLPEQVASRNTTMEIFTDDEKIVLTDINIGEVWLAGGQSNMEFHMKFDQDFNEEVAKGRFKDIRLFDYPEVAYEGEQNDYDYSQFGLWRKATPEDLPYFSAVAYYFADSLSDDLDVPIGIIGCNWGGTPACSWIDPKYLAHSDGEVWLREYEENVMDLDMNVYENIFRANPNNNRTTMLDDPMNIKLMRDGFSWEEQVAFVNQIMAMAGMDQDQSGDTLTEPLQLGPWSEQRPGGLYEHMLKKVAPYSIRGVIWYQGESDYRHPEVYRTVFTQLIQCWRDLWKDDLPFLYVQLAPFEKWLFTNGLHFPLIRRLQDAVSMSVPGVWMTTSGDVGMALDIHPKKKKPIGQRLAKLALGHVYGRKLLCDAPEFLCVEKKDDLITIHFSNADGLHFDGDHVKALELIDANGLPVEIKSQEVTSSTLILSGCENAVTVRYAQCPYYESNLFNGADIPAKPFEAVIDQV